MLQSILPDQISPERKFNNFFELAKMDEVGEQNMKEYTNKLKSQTESETRDTPNQSDQGDALNED